MQGDHSREVALHLVGGEPAEATSPEARAASCICVSRRTSTARRACRSSFGLFQLCPSDLWRWCLLVRRGGRLVLPGLGRMAWHLDAGRRVSGPFLLLGGRGEATLATTGAPAGAVVSKVAGRSGRAKLPRPPSLPGSRLHS
jgi:hypothetical protein